MNQLYKHCLQCISIVLLLLNQSASFAQEKAAPLSGTVSTNDGKKAADVTVSIRALSLTTVTDENGDFQFDRIPVGNHLVQVSLVGYQTVEQRCTITTQTPTHLAIQLLVSEKQLEEVIVRSGQNKFAVKQSGYVAKMPLTNLENPQSYTVIGKQLIQEQVITNFNDVLKNAAGVDKLWSATGRGSDGAAYFSLRGFAVQPSMVNGIAAQTNGGLDPANIEQVEVIKGPSSTLFGSSLVSFGGLINIVTKQPVEATKGTISYTNGTFGLNRLTADYNTALNKEKTLLFRINGAYQQENSFQDAGFKKSIFLAPAITYRASDKLSLQFNAEFYNSEATNPVMIFLNRSRKLIYTTPQQLNIDYYKSFTSNDITIKNPTTNFYGQANYKLGKRWTSQTSFSQSIRQSNGLYSYVMLLQSNNDTLLNRYISAQNSNSTSTNFQQNFIGEFSIGKIRNRLVAGIDVASFKTTNNSTAYIQFDQVNSVTADARYAQITRQSVEAKIAANTAPTKTNSDAYTYGIYLSNVTNITEQLLVMTSLRIDRFDNKGTKTISTNITSGNFKQNTLSPKLGLVYALVKNKLSVFGNYQNGFKNVAPVTQPDGSVSTFTPQQANQWEAGIKMDAWQGKLTGTLSYYNIAVTDVLIPDPNRVGFTIQEGDVKSTGFETDLIANPVAGLNIVAGYSYNDSKNTRAAAATDGRRPTNAGPRNLANVWMSYTFQKAALKGFGIGFGGNYASENMITNSLATGIFTIPAYTVLNGTIFYNHQNIRLALKVDNIGNVQYWKGWSTIEPQLPRRVSTSVTFKF